MPLAKTHACGNNPHGWAAVESAAFFTGVSPEDFRRITVAARLKRFARGDMLYVEGDTVWPDFVAHLWHRENYETGT